MADLAHRTLRAELGAPDPVLHAPGLAVRLLAPTACLLVTSDVAMQPGVALGDDPAWLWQAQGKALVVSFAEKPPVAAALATDITDGVAAVALVGSRVPDILVQGCTLDPPALAPGRCAQTLFAGVSVTLHATERGLTLYAERSLAAWLLAWLERATAALG